MPNINDRQGEDIKPFSLEHIANQSFDQTTQISMTENVGFDGQNIQRPNADNLALRTTESGSITYVALAAPGSLQSDAVWQCRKIDETSGTVITWADGDSNFDNVATNLASLTYS